MASIMSLVLTIDPSVSGALQDDFGVWEYAGATGTDQNSGATVKLIATKRSAKSASFQPSATTLTACVQFDNSGVPAANLTLQGIHDLESNDESGSVSAASQGLADYIGGTFTFDATKLLLTIHPRETAAYAPIPSLGANLTAPPSAMS